MEDEITYDELIAINGIRNPVIDNTFLEGINEKIGRNSLMLMARRPMFLLY